MAWEVSCKIDPEIKTFDNSSSLQFSCRWIHLCHITYRPSIILDLKPFRSKLQRKEFWQKIPKSSCAMKEAVDIEILLTSRNSDRKNHAIYQDNE